MTRRYSSGNVSPMSSPPEMWRRDKWSATEFSLPFVFYLQVEFLKEQHPSYKSWFGLFVGEQVFQGRMISVDDDLAPQDVRPEFLESVDHRKKLFLCSCVINLSFN